MSARGRAKARSIMKLCLKNSFIVRSWHTFGPLYMRARGAGGFGPLQKPVIDYAVYDGEKRCEVGAEHKNSDERQGQGKGEEYYEVMLEEFLHRSIMAYVRTIVYAGTGRRWVRTATKASN